jgi:glutamate/tyrosine decarboxylase-like PLP-dependent enzyme
LTLLRANITSSKLLTAVKDLVTQFISSADQDASSQASGHGLQVPGGGPRSVLVEHHTPKKLESLFSLSLPEQGLGHDGFLSVTKELLQYSVNTWDQGFLAKLYSSTTPVGLAADLLLSALNTNVHVYSVAPALTLVEKRTARALAALYGWDGPHAGGVSQPGGSAANLSAVVIARNNLFPETKTDGNGAHKFVLFTSAHGHYSLEKAAQMLGLGARAARSVAVDEQGAMRPDALRKAIQDAKDAGETPFFVNATAGTTVLGAYDPLDALAEVCEEHKLWLHVDGSWGGPAIFSEKHASKLAGSKRADSLTISPHKMLGVPVTCSFLLGKDLRQFHKGMSLPAEYLFHGDEDSSSNAVASAGQALENTHLAASPPNNAQDIYDLASLVPQCGRRGDALKLALTWVAQGRAGLAAYVDTAFERAAELAKLVSEHDALTLASTNPPPCLQVCFYYGHGKDNEHNTRVTEQIAKRLVPRGFMTDYAPGEQGKFLRVVVNGQTRRETLEGLVKAVVESGQEVEKMLQGQGK